MSTLLLLAPLLAQSVLVVDPTDPALFVTVQAAIDAAQPGDTVAIRPGEYGAATVAGKPLVLMGVPGPTGELPELDSLTVGGIPAGATCVVRALAVDQPAGIDLAGSSGTLLLDGVVGTALDVDQCAAVALVECEFDRGAEVHGSHLDLFDSVVEGVDFQNPAGTGLRLESSTAYISGSVVRGGRGAFGADGGFPLPFCSDGGPGGVGLVLIDSTVTEIDSIVSGGAGGPAGTAKPGFPSCSQGPTGTPVVGDGLTTLPDTGFFASGHRLATNGPVQGGPLVLELDGVGQEDVLLFLSTASTSVYLPPWNGPLQVDPASGFFFLAGQLDAFGRLELVFPVTVPPHRESIQLPVQAFFVDTSGIGTDHVAGARWVQVFRDDVPLVDCDGDGTSDALQIALGSAADCDGDGLIDACAIALGLVADCDGSGIPDSCEVAPTTDCDGDGVLDACAIGLGQVPDCNGNGIPDSCDVASGASLDLDGDGVPDECSQTLRVPGQFPTIAEAVAAAASGDTIVLADGTYSGPGNTSIDVGDKFLTLRSQGGPDQCVIDLSGAHNALRLTPTGGTTTIEGIHFRDDGTSTTNFWGAIYAENADLRVVGCRFEACAGELGGALRLFWSSVESGQRLEVIDTRFVDCVSLSGAGAIHLFTSGTVLGSAELAVDRCVFEGNSTVFPAAFTSRSAGAIRWRNLPDGNAVRIANSLFRGNVGAGRGAGALVADGGEVRVEGCTFVENVLTGDFGGAALLAEDGQLAVRHSIAWQNVSSTGVEVQVTGFVTGFGAEPLVDWSTVDGGPPAVAGDSPSTLTGPALSSADPSFVDPTGLDYRLQPTSPAIDAGNPGFVPGPGETDLDGALRVQGAAVDHGCYETGSR